MRPHRLIATALLALAATGCAATFNAGAALVNGVSISTDLVAARVDANAAASGQQPPEGEARRAQERQALTELVLDELLRQEAAERDVGISDEEVDARLDEIRAQFPSEEEFLSRIEQAGFTLEVLRDQIFLRAAADALRERLRPQVSDADLRAVYETSEDQFKQARIRHILFSVQPGADGAPEERRARATYAEIQGGASFSDLAERRSDDTSAGNGGRLPGWTLLSALDAGFAAGVESAEIGEVTEPVRSQFGWHLILVDARRTQPFAQVRAQLRDQLEQQGADSAFQRFLIDLATSADVDINPRFGDWDPAAATIVPHRFFTEPEPDVLPQPFPGTGFGQ